VIEQKKQINRLANEKGIEIVLKEMEELKDAKNRL
jgi:hypothetical protein